MRSHLKKYAWLLLDHALYAYHNLKEIIKQRVTLISYTRVHSSLNATRSFVYECILGLVQYMTGAKIVFDEVLKKQAFGW